MFVVQKENGAIEN